MNKRRRKRRSPAGGTKARFVEPDGRPHLSAMVTVSELAADLGVTRQHVVNLIKRDQIQAVKLGDIYRIPRPVRDRLVNAERLPEPSAKPVPAAE